jgi:hypothetical protein
MLETKVSTNTLTYQLLNPPTGMAIDGNGLISWLPTEDHPSTVSTVTRVATDKGVPELGATNSFVVTVIGPATAPVIQSITVSNDIVIIISSALSGRSYRLLSKGRLDQTNWADIIPEAVAVEESVVLTNATGAASERSSRVFLVPQP